MTRVQPDTTSPRETVAVILAAGSGTRFGSGVPKQFVQLAGQPVIAHTLRVFQDHGGIDRIVVMVSEQHLSTVREIIDRYSFGKVTDVAVGGNTRNETSQIALSLVDDSAKVLFHDAVRPFVSDRIIDDCIVALDSYDAVDVAINSADTLITVSDSNTIESIPDRATLRRGQTPQGFRASVLTASYDLANRDANFKATDDCGVVLTYTPDIPVFVVAGDDENMKITEPIDIHIADKVFQLRQRSLSASVTAAALATLNGQHIVVVGASYGIGAEVADLAEARGCRVTRLSRSSGIDIRDERALHAAFAAAHAENGPIHSVVVTAGLLDIAPLVDATEDRLHEIVDVNLFGPINAARVAHGYLRETSGSLLFFTSSSYTRGRANYSIYSATKAAIVNLTQALAEEWGPERIRVNCINPQRTATPMRTRAFGDEDPSTLLTADEVARVSLATVVSEISGSVVDVRQGDVP